MKPSQRNLAMMAAVLFSTTAPAAAPMVVSRPRNEGRSLTYGEPAETCDYGLDRDTVQSEKQQRAPVQKKRHKAKAFHVQHRPVPTGKVSKFFERVTDPDKEEREAMQAKDPFGRMEGRW